MKKIWAIYFQRVAMLLLCCATQSFADMPEKAAVCVACHGPNGNSSMPNTPSLAGQNARYIYLQLRDFQEGRRKAKLGFAKADETLCAMCHLGEFRGQNEIPKVAGQNYDYIVKTLLDFKAKNRTNDAGNMTSVANTLSPADIENLAHYIAGLN